MFAALEDLLAGNEGCFIAPNALHKAAAAGRHVVHELGLLHLQPVEIDQIDIRAQPGREAPAIGEAEEIGGFTGLPLDQVLQRQARPARAVVNVALNGSAALASLSAVTAYP